MTAATGLDAVSFLSLGNVFTANMTGNIVILAFATARVSGTLPSGPTDSTAQVTQPRNYDQTNDVIELGGSTTFSTREPNLHCTCCSTLLLFVSTRTRLLPGFSAAT